MLRVCLLVAPLCAAVVVKSPWDSVGGGGDVIGVDDGSNRNPTYRLWGKVYNASYAAAPPGGLQDEVLQSDDSDVPDPVTAESPPSQPDDPEEEDCAEDAPPLNQVQDTQVECVDTEPPIIWKGMLNCLRKKRFFGCVSGFLSRQWRRVSTATGRKKALRRFYLPLLLLLFKFKLLVVVLGMVAALAGKSAIVSVVSLAVAAGVAIKTSLGVHHDFHNNKRFDSGDLAGQQTSSLSSSSSSTTGNSNNNHYDGGYYVH